MEKLRRHSSRIKNGAISTILEKSVVRTTKKFKSKKPIKPLRFGEIVTVNETDFSGNICQPIVAKKRQKETGTEEILGDIVVLDKFQIDSTPSKAVSEIQSKQKPRKRRSPSIEICSDSECIPIQRPKKPVPVPHILLSDDDEESNEISGYQIIWKEALKKAPENTREDYEVPVKKPYSVVPFPRPQPMHYLNKFISNKNSLNIPSFRCVKNRGPMMFSHSSISKQFNGSLACSKVAGNILADIMCQKKQFDKLFCMQIPNSLRIFNNQNVQKIEAEDIYLENQNSFHYNNAAETNSQQQKHRNFHRSLALTGFSKSQPFGKLLLLKSGKVVLQIGVRRFDVITTSPNHDHQTGVIVDFTNTSHIKPPIKTSATSVTSASQSPNKIALHSLGKIEHFFSAFYNYSNILKTLPPITSSIRKMQQQQQQQKELPKQTCGHIVDLTANDYCHDEKLKEKNETDDKLKKKKEKNTKKGVKKNDNDMLKISKRKTTTKRTPINLKSHAKKDKLKIIKNKKKVEFVIVENITKASSAVATLPSLRSHCRKSKQSK